jgi:hypothetical protein
MEDSRNVVSYSVSGVKDQPSSSSNPPGVILAPFSAMVQTLQDKQFSYGLMKCVEMLTLTYRHRYISYFAASGGGTTSGSVSSSVSENGSESSVDGERRESQVTVSTRETPVPSQTPGTLNIFLLFLADLHGDTPLQVAFRSNHTAFVRIYSLFVLGLLPREQLVSAPSTTNSDNEKFVRPARKPIPKFDCVAFTSYLSFLGSRDRYVCFY